MSGATALEQEDRQQNAAHDNADDHPDHAHLTSFVGKALILTQRSVQGVVLRHRVVPWLRGATPEHRQHA